MNSQHQVSVTSRVSKHRGWPCRPTGSMQVDWTQAPQSFSGALATMVRLALRDAMAPSGYPVTPVGPNPQLPPVPVLRLFCT